MEKNVFGTVKWFDCDLGYGYIKRGDAGEDVIVHNSGIKEGQLLKKGTKVLFDIGQKPKNVLDIRRRPHGAQRLPVASNVKQLETFSGRVKCFDAELEHGFIIREDTNEDVIVHRSAVEMGSGPLNKGDKVEFNVVGGRRRARALNVTKKLESREDLWRKQCLAKDVLGRVKCFDPELGYGFIIREDTNEDVIVHKSAIELGSGPLNAGDEVEFDVVADRKGAKASYVTRSLGGGRGSHREFPLEDWLLEEVSSKGESNEKKGGRSATPNPDQLCCGGAVAKMVLLDDDGKGAAFKLVCGICVQTKEENEETVAREEEALEEKFKMLLKGKNKLVTSNNKVKSRKYKK